jgi:hypothetical protein
MRLDVARHVDQHRVLWTLAAYPELAGVRRECAFRRLGRGDAAYRAAGRHVLLGTAAGSAPPSGQPRGSVRKSCGRGQVAAALSQRLREARHPDVEARTAYKFVQPVAVTLRTHDGCVLAAVHREDQRHRGRKRSTRAWISAPKVRLSDGTFIKVRCGGAVVQSRFSATESASPLIYDIACDGPQSRNQTGCPHLRTAQLRLRHTACISALASLDRPSPRMLKCCTTNWNTRT